MRSNIAVTLVLVVLAFLRGSTAAAQQTRAEQPRRQRADQAAKLHPYERTRVESALYVIEPKQLGARIFNPPRGLFARVGGLVEQAGLAAGPAFRLSRPALSFTVSSAVSTKAYWVADATLVAPQLADGRLFTVITATHKELPQQDFYGLGSASLRTGRTNFALSDSVVSGLIGTRLTPWLTISGLAEYLAPRVAQGTDRRMPSIEAVFTEAAAPGLGQQPDFRRLEGRAIIDYTAPADRPDSGGRYSVAYQRFADLDFHRFSFDRLDLDLQQYVPIIDGFRTIALRALASVSDPAPGQDVPFYLQRTLGGAYSLRGLDPYRMRDRNLLLLQAEYRWTINAFASGALFFDTGKVGHQIDDLNLRNLERDYGIGVRLGSAHGVALRADIAFGSHEGTRVMLRFNDVF